MHNILEIDEFSVPKDEPFERVPYLRQPKQYVAPLTIERAKTLTIKRDGSWNEERAAGRNAGCFACGSFDMAVTPKPKGVVMCCNACGAGRRDNLLFEGAIKAGFECGPGPSHRRRGDFAKLLLASEAALARLKPAERRVLVFCATQTRTRDWVEVSRRSIVGTCNVSARDVIPLLNRLAERGLLRVRSNDYAAKRTTQIAFLVDPRDLVTRLWTAPENGTTP
jgi:hypothetical protein